MLNLARTPKSILPMLIFIGALIIILTESEQSVINIIVSLKDLCFPFWGQRLPGLFNLKGALRQHFKFPIPAWNTSQTCAFRETTSPCSSCKIRPELWDCVGEDRNWSLVFVDNRPGSKRGPNALRLVTRSQVVLAHDTNQNDAVWPKDWLSTRRGDTPVWAGRRVFTDPRPGTWTTLIQGDVDEGGRVFDAVVKIFKEDTAAVEKAWREFNPSGSAWGSHVRLLAAAAMATTGDILELGTGLFSTPLLHGIVLGQNSARMIVSTDTDATWLPLFSNMSSEFHQVLLVPVYSDGGTCGKYPGPSRPRPPVQDLAFAGQPRHDLVGNTNIQCPK